jgi:hypothetical protein
MQIDYACRLSMLTAVARCGYCVALSATLLNQAGSEAPSRSKPGRLHMLDQGESCYPFVAAKSASCSPGLRLEMSLNLQCHRTLQVSDTCACCHK